MSEVSVVVRCKCGHVGHLYDDWLNPRGRCETEGCACQHYDPRPKQSTGTIVSLEFTIADHNPTRAAETVERHLRPLIEEALQGEFGRHVLGAPIIHVMGERP